MKKKPNIDDTLDTLRFFGKCRKLDAWLEERGKNPVAVDEARKIIKPVGPRMSSEEQGQRARELEALLDPILIDLKIDKEN
ncbi:MAG TPA: hypothetical protein DCY12_05445 [Candidatus Atribacteria bacterium]|nr:hypothetical protein [Candidatus Atribacteria bacterium]